jgi:ribosomal-protein-alanine N-acetyltransferase
MLRRPLVSDQRAFLAAVRNSGELHFPWVRAPSTPGEFRACLGRLDQRVNWGWLMCLKG